MFVILENIVAIKTKMGGDAFYEVGRFNSEIFQFISIKNANPNSYTFDSTKFKFKNCIEFEESLFSPIFAPKMEVLIIERDGNFITSFVCTGASFISQVEDRGTRKYRLHLNNVSKMEKVEVFQKAKGEYFLE